MCTRYNFQNLCKWCKKVLLILCFDILFLVLALIFTFLHLENSRILSIVFMLLDFVFLLHTAFHFHKTTMLIGEMEEYYSSNNYGTSAFRLGQFYKLLNNNLLEYHFQPIINAATGEIFAYEALMRANADDIDMQPLEILEIASRENCLYEIEKCTFFNTLQAMNKYSDVFKTKKLFINSISSKQLKDEDFDRLYKEYGHLFINLVIEITEATDIDEQNLTLLHKRLQKTNCQLALDDYGTGYANVSNLLNTNPNYIKIDQSILRYINVDEKKQQLVSNLISFASQNNIKVIAEGIESYDELEYVIKLGVDYIQGFYTARPNPCLIDTMSDDILKKIQEINYKRLCVNTEKKVYETKNEAFLSTVAIAFERYTDIIINEREITLKGNLGMTADTSILIPNNRNCRLVLDNINLQGNDRPAIIIGKNCSVLIELVGDNYLVNNGIRLPETSELIITGEGNLTIHSEHTARVGIGGTAEQAYGNITLASTGNIIIKRSGNISIGIGGGHNIANSLIRLKSGNIMIDTFGYLSVGIGCLNGNARIMIDDTCRLKIKTEATRAVSIGSIKGMADIVTSGRIDIKLDGKYSVAIGVIEEGNGNISILCGTVSIYFNAHTGSGIGTINGNADIHILEGDILVYGEGADIAGIGDQRGSGDIHISGGIISVQLYAANALPIGNVKRSVIIDGGNIQCNFPEDIIPVNSHQTPLAVYIITKTDEFRQYIETIAYSYEYRADYSNRFPYIKVYMPENIIVPFT